MGEVLIFVTTLDPLRLSRNCHLHLRKPTFYRDNAYYGRYLCVTYIFLDFELDAHLKASQNFRLRR